MAFTLGSTGTAGRSFLDDMAQADERQRCCSAFVGGVVFNLSNILLVAAIDIAGMAVAFPIGVGLALVLGVITNYMASPVGNPMLLFLGVGCVVAAIVLSAVSYSRLPAQGQRTIGKGIVVSVVAGLLMGFFYRFVAASMSADFINLEPGKLGPYTAIVVFSAGLLASNFLWNTIVMKRPFVGAPVAFGDYFSKGSPRLHLIGILGGVDLESGDVAQHHRRRRRRVRDFLRAGAGRHAGGGLVGRVHLEGVQGAPAGTSPLLARCSRLRRRPDADRRGASGLRRGYSSRLRHRYHAATERCGRHASASRSARFGVGRVRSL